MTAGSATLQHHTTAAPVAGTTRLDVPEFDYQADSERAIQSVFSEFPEDVVHAHAAAQMLTLGGTERVCVIKDTITWHIKEFTDLISADMLDFIIAKSEANETHRREITAAGSVPILVVFEDAVPQVKAQRDQACTAGAVPDPAAPVSQRFDETNGRENCSETCSAALWEVRLFPFLKTTRAASFTSSPPFVG